MASHGGNEMRGCQNQSGTSNSLGAKLNHIGSIVPRDSQFRKKMFVFIQQRTCGCIIAIYIGNVAILYYCQVVLLPFFGGKKKNKF